MTSSDDGRPPVPSDLTTPLPNWTDQATTAMPGRDRSSPEPSSRSAGRREGLPTFSPNEVVSGRYEIVRFVAQGGMGEVYEAQDLQLHGRVALKTILPEIALDPATLERFKREIHLARRVTHSNVSRIFDIGVHKPETDNVTFLTMEFLAGETLADRLRRTGPMQPAEALPIVRQMAAGLEAAHAQGIVHRDFKTGNVVLAGTGDSLRAVVTDFGLARGDTATDSFAASVSGLGDIVGSPSYMAPEQVEGGKITPAADVYAFGIVMFEMVTGKLPFVGDSAMLTAVKRLAVPAPSPCIHVSDLDPRWDKAILRCLERDPADRFVNVADVLKALGGEEVAAGRRETRVHRQRLAMAGAAILVLVAVLLGRNISVSRKLETVTQAAATAAPPALPAPPKTLRRSIAVLGFKNLSGQSAFAWLSTALSEMFGSELAAGEKLRVVSGEEVARMKIDLGLGEADSLAPDTLGRIRAHSHSDFVVLGSYLAMGEKSGGKVRLDLKLQETSGEGALASIIGDGTESDLSALVSGTAARLREKLGARKIRPADLTAIKATLPSGPEALRLYSEGIAKLRSFDALAARELLEKAVAADPNHALAHSALASAWSLLGYHQKAKEEAKMAFDLSAVLPREDRLLVQGSYHEAMNKWNEAIETYRTLWIFAPDNLDYGLRLASAQRSGGKGKDALLVTEALRTLPPPARDDPRIDLAEASAAESLGEHKRALAAAGRAAEKGKKNDLRLLLAKARLMESGTFRTMGEMEKAKSAAEEAQGIYAAAGDKQGVATARFSIAAVLSSQGDLAGAKEMYEESLVIRREIGDKGGLASSMNSIGIVLMWQGDPAGAKRMYDKSLAIFREIGNKQGVARTLGYIAEVLSGQGDFIGARRAQEESVAIFREIGDKRGVAWSSSHIAEALWGQGDLAGAKKIHEEALAIHRESGNKYFLAISLGNNAEVLREEGDLAGAKKNAGEALATARETGHESSSAWGLEQLGHALRAEGDLPGARKHYEEALEILKTLGEELYAAAVRLALVELSLEEGEPDQAVTAAREMASFFQKEKDSDSEGSARAILARALLETRDVAAAAKEIARAESLTQKSQKALSRAAIGMTSARIRAASGKPADIAAARKSLESSLVEATKNGWAARAFETRLALGEIEMRTDPAAGRARLAGLEKDARAKRFGLIAREAAKLAAGPVK